jgi:small GTP-binding protein
MTSYFNNDIRYSTNSAFDEMKCKSLRIGNNLDGNKSSDRTRTSLGVDTITYPLKISLIGDSSVGKTSLITKFCEGKFDPENSAPTIGPSSQVKTVKVDTFSEAKMDIWDTAGAEKFSSITQNHIRDSNGIILVFDLGNEESFKNLDKWMEKINDVVDVKKVEIILVGNKSDLADIKVSEDMATKYAGEHGIKYLSVSTKDGLNIGFLFELIATSCVGRIIESQSQEIKEKDDDDTKKLKKENNMDALSIEGNNKKDGVKKKPRKKCC